MRVAFIGKTHSGKSTSADYLIDEYEYRSFSFAHPVKELVAEMLTLAEQHLAERGRIYSYKNYDPSRLEEMRQELIAAYKQPYRPIIMSNSEIEVQYMQPKTWTVEDVETHKGNDVVRQMIQLVGHGVGRQLIGHEDVWVRKLITRTSFLDDIIVDDCRYQNEARALQEAGFTLVKVTRPEHERIAELQAKYRNNLDKILSHPSEAEVDKIETDVVIYAQTVEELYKKLEELFT